MRSLWLLLWLVVPACRGFGGLGTKQKEEDKSNPVVDLDDPELQAAMKMFANLSPDVLQEVMQHVLQLLGGDDAEVQEVIQAVMKEIPHLQSSDVELSLKDIMQQDAIQQHIQGALEMVNKNSHEAVWNTMYEMRDEILNLVSGQMDATQWQQLKENPKLWETELKQVWEELVLEATVTGEL